MEESDYTGVRVVKKDGRGAVYYYVSRHINRALEFHDSEVASVSGDQERLTMSFSEAYIHSSSGVPGVSPGDGYVQPAKLVFSRVSWSGPISEAAGPLSNGVIRIDGKNLSLLPLPFQAEGDVAAEFTFVSGVRLSVQARAVRCSVDGDARWVETYDG